MFWSLARPTPVVHLGLSRVRTYICVPSRKRGMKVLSSPHFYDESAPILLFEASLHSAKGVGEIWKKGEVQEGPWSGFEGSSIPPSQLKIPSWMVLGWDTKRNILQNTIHPSCPFWRGRPCFYYIFLPNMSIIVMMLALQCFVAHYLSNLDHVWSKEPWHL